MFHAIQKTLGLSTASSGELIIVSFIAVVLAVLVGYLIDACADISGFGVYGNAIVLLATMIAGLIGYDRFIEPLRHAPFMTLLVIGLASSVFGFLGLSYAKARALH